jgi:hypothetical protein
MRDTGSRISILQFYLIVLIQGVLAPIYIFFLPPTTPRTNDRATQQRLRSLDGVGAVLWAGVLTAYTLFGSLGGVVWSWSSGRTIACIVVSFVCIVAFSVQQKYSIAVRPQDRLFPVHILRGEQWILFVGCGTAFACCMVSQDCLVSCLRLAPIALIITSAANHILCAHLLSIHQR